MEEMEEISSARWGFERAERYRRRKGVKVEGRKIHRGSCRDEGNEEEQEEWMV